MVSQELAMEGVELHVMVEVQEFQDLPAYLNLLRFLRSVCGRSNFRRFGNRDWATDTQIQFLLLRKDEGDKASPIDL